jgi:hypothetical protein
MPSYAFPPPPPGIEPTPIEEVDRVVDRLAENKQAWVNTPIPARLEILAEMRHRVADVAEEWAEAGSKARGFTLDEPAAGEEWLTGPMATIRNIRMLERSLGEIHRDGHPMVRPEWIGEREDGRLTVRVFPLESKDRAQFPGATMEVWLQPGVTRETLTEHLAVHYRSPDPAGKVSLILGAGNVSSLAPTDMLYKLFVENEVVVLKMNPVNEYLGPLFRRAFKPLVDRGVFEVVYGGAAVGAHLSDHPKVDTLHLTGSDATYDAIVWGPTEGREERKKKGEKRLEKPFTSELGNVTPIVVVPGPWTEAEMDYQAANVATMVVNNASFNCVAAKVLVTPGDWDFRERFLAKVRQALADSAPRKAYYPGARDRWQTFVDAHPEAVKLSEEVEGTVPWTWIGDLDPEAEDEICFQTEPFCGVLHEVALPGETAAAFLDRAVPFCNEKLWGTLACTLLVHGATRKDPAGEEAIQKALDALRYGTIAFNQWPGIPKGLATGTWGAYPGHTAEDIQSSPFTMAYTPPWFVTHRRCHKVGRAFTRFEANPSWLRLLPVAFHTFLG